MLATASGVLVGGATPSYSTAPTLTGTNFTSIPNSATTAASANGASTIVSRDINGSFTGNVVTATTFSGSGASLTSIPNSATTASSANGASTIVSRDATGNFAANTITANLTGTASTATNVAASGLTGTTLSSNVTASSLTSFGASIALGTPASGTLTNCTFPTLNQNTTGSAATFTSTSQNSQFNSIGVGTAASTTAGDIRATTNITAYYSSDRQFKENIEYIPNALEIVDSIGGKYFDWTEAYLEAHGGEDEYFLHKQDFGVIAQDVQLVFPRGVRTRPDGTLAVDYEKLVAVAFAAIKELKAEVAELKAR